MTGRITILPETDDTTLCVRLTGHINARDYKQNYGQQIADRAKRHGFFNLLVYYDEHFTGWDADAAELNFKSICELADNARKLAYINPGESKIMLMKLAGPMLVADIRYFDAHELQTALEWIKETP